MYIPVKPTELNRQPSEEENLKNYLLFVAGVLCEARHDFSIFALDGEMSSKYLDTVSVGDCFVITHGFTSELRSEYFAYLAMRHAPGAAFMETYKSFSIMYRGMLCYPSSGVVANPAAYAKVVG